MANIVDSLIPSVGETESTVIGKHIIFVSISQDQDADNPLDDGYYGHIRSFSSRHIDNIGVEEALKLLESDPGVVPLSYYEHGGSVWTRFAGIWTPTDGCELPTEPTARRKAALEQAALTCELYSQWANGDCYGYRVTVFKLREEDGDVFEEEDDYRFDEPVFEESCWGFYGYDSVEEEVKSTAQFALDSIN